MEDLPAMDPWIPRTIKHGDSPTKNGAMANNDGNVQGLDYSWIDFLRTILVKTVVFTAQIGWGFL